MPKLRALAGKVNRRKAVPVTQDAVKLDRWVGFDGEPIDSQHLIISMLLPPAVKEFYRQMEAEVEAVCGGRYRHGSANQRWGSQDGSITLANQKVRIKRPRVRNAVTKNERTMAQNFYRDGIQAIREADRNVNSPDAAVAAVQSAIENLTQAGLLLPVDTLDRDRISRVLRQFVVGQNLLLSARDGLRNGDGLTTRQQLSVTGYWVVGSESRDTGEALSSWNAECEAFRSMIFAVVDSSLIDSFDCGSMQNVSHYSSIGYFAYGSTPTLSLRFASRSPALESAGGYVVGGEFRADVPNAARTWNEACERELNRARSTYWTRFLAASCGEPRNVSSAASIDYYQYGSTSKVWLKALENTP